MEAVGILAGFGLVGKGLYLLPGYACGLELLFLLVHADYQTVFI
jgi:hypothetical protein